MDQHAALFASCLKGDLKKAQQYIKECRDPNLKMAVDKNEKSPMHVSAEEGKTAIIELLLLNNFSVNARDRLLKTPLHYATLHGWDVVVDTLLKNGGDPKLKDNQGRSSIHFACCGPSNVILQLLISTRPELVNDLDSKRKTPLHYCVWNESKGQVELMRTLLDFNANPNALDEDLKTPLHNASEGGRTRAIPILMQRGGIPSMALRDRSGKLPLELSLNDRTREQLIIYSASPKTHNQEDITWMNQAVQGQASKLGPVSKASANAELQEIRDPNFVPNDMQSPMQSPYKSSGVMNVQSQSFPPQQQQYQMLSKGRVQQNNTQELAYQASPPPEQIETNVVHFEGTQINSWIREKFFVIMKKVQEAGIKANHHLKKPYIYTASWMEGINTMEELFDVLKDVQPGEISMRIFNILCPYDRALPKRSGLEEIVDGFYGEQWYDTTQFTNQKRIDQQDNAKRQLQLNQVNRISELELSVQNSEKLQFESDLELAKIKAQLEVTKKVLQDQEGKVAKEIESLNQQLKIEKGITNGYKADALKFQKQIKEVELERDTWRNTPQGPSDLDIQKQLDEISALKQHSTMEREKEKQLRFKSGQLFVKSINDAKEQFAVKLEQQSKQTQMLSKDKQAQQVVDPQKVVADPNKAAGGVENMQDDDAIIALFKALKGNPPQMTQRMKNVDSDGDDKVNQIEFTSFLKTLKLSDQAVLSLCRIAGFLNDTKLLGITDWVLILQERPKQREMWEQKLFNKLLDAIKSKNLTLEKTFELLDTDNSGTVTPSELKFGLKQLKIVLNPLDLSNMFCIFDGDKSGSISLVEMKEILDHYAQMRQAGDDQGEDWDGRVSQVKSDDRVYEDIVAVDKPYNEQVSKGWVIDEKDFKVMNGCVTIQIPKGTGLLDMNALKVIAIKVILRGGERDAEIDFIMFNADMDWKQVISIPIVNTLRENLCDDLIVQLYSSKEHLDKEHFLGDVHSSWKTCIDQPGQWAINNQFDLTNKTFIEEEKKMKKVSGKINLQFKYEPGDDGKLENIKTGNGEQTFMGTIVEDGMVEITLVQCILSDDTMKLKGPEFLCDFKFMNTKETDMKGKLVGKNLQYERKFLVPLKCVTNSPIPSIYVKVQVEYDKGMLGMTHKTKVFGEVYINWQECIIHPGELLSRKSFLLTKESEHPQKLYMKIRYVPHSMLQNVVGFKVDVSEKDKMKALMEEDLQEGTLKILFVRAKNLRADDGDTSDPYVIAKLDSWKKQLKLQSKTIKKTLNPEWKEMQSIQCRVPKEAPFPPLDIELMDEDMVGDDSLGTCQIDLTPSFMNPCTWAVNDFTKVNDPKFKSIKPDIFPLLYLQAYWVPKGQKDPNLKPKDKEDKAGGDPDPNSIIGKMFVKIVHARELNAGKGINPDPYCTVTFPGGSEKKTETISSTINPLWNQTLVEPIKVDRQTGTSIPLKLFIKDHNFSSDGVIGYCDVAWAQCVQQPGEWGLNQVFTVNGTSDSKGQGSLGFLYIQVKFLEQGMIDDGSEAPLVENLLEMISSKQGIWQGNLRVFLVHCSDLVKADSGSDELSDPYVIFKVPGGIKLETKAKTKTLNPSWKEIYTIKISMPKDTIQPLRLEVYDEDLIGDELIGYMTADLSECFQNPQKWQYNEISKLNGDQVMQKKFKTTVFGKVYIQIMFCLQGVDCQELPLPLTEDLDAILREKAQEGKKLLKGQLVINVPLALGLKIGDASTKTSDPYCKIMLPDGHTVQTNVKDMCLDPIWNYTYKWNCNIIKECYKPIKFIIYDKDSCAIDDLLGQVEVEWMVCYENPTNWEVNKLLPLQGEQQMGEDLGKVNIQMQFLMDGQEKTPEGQRAPDTIPELKDQYGRVLGTIQVKIISASNLFNTDWGLQGTTDPFVEAYLSTDVVQKKMKTKVIDNNLNPEFNFDGSFNIQLLRCQVKTCIISFDVMDDGITSDLVGTVEVDIIDVLEQNTQSLATADYPLKNKKKAGNPNLGTLKLTFIWVPDAHNEGVVGLRVPPPTYSGELIINYPNGKQLSKDDHFISFYLTHQLKKIYDNSKTMIKSDKNPEFKYKEIIPFVDVTESQIRTMGLTSTVMNYHLIKNMTFGGITLSLRDCFRTPATWFNNYLQLFDDDGKKIDSYLYVQAYWKEKDSKEVPAEEPPLIDFSQFIKQGKPITFSGKFILSYIGLKNLKKSDPFFEIKLSKGTNQAFVTKTQENKLDCFWEDPGVITLTNLTKEDLESLTMYVNIIDKNILRNELIGKMEIDLSGVVKNNGTWYNQNLGLLDEKGCPEKSEMYIQCQWVQDDELPVPSNQKPNNIYNDIKQKHDEDVAIKKKEAEAQATIPKSTGKLRVFVQAARNLKKVDTFSDSDPYVEMNISKGDKSCLKTLTITDNLNPIWKFQGVFNLNLQKQEYVDMKLHVTVKDYDIPIDGFLGFIEINLDELFKTPGNWINGIYLLQDEHTIVGKNGDIYFQIQWAPDDMANSISNPPELLPYAIFDPKKQPQQIPIQTQQQKPIVIQGVIQVNMVKLTNVPEGQKTQSKLSILGQEVKTNLVQSGVDWNSKQTIDVKCSDKQILDAKCDIVIQDEKQIQIATLNVDIASLFLKPASWINQYYPFQLSTLKPNIQKIYLQLQWRPSTIDNIDKTDPSHIEDPDQILPQEKQGDVQSSAIQQPAMALSVIAPIVPPKITKGIIKVAIMQADKILLLDGNKSNVQVKIEYDGHDDDTQKVEGAKPRWATVLKLKQDRVDLLKPIIISLYHHPTFGFKVFMGDVIVSDLAAIFAKPGEWAIKSEALLGQSNTKSKVTITGNISFQIGFIPDKSPDTLKAV